MILPAAGGPTVVDVVERTYSNAVEQRVSLFTSSSIPGQNYINIQMFGPMEMKVDGEKRLGYRSVHAAQLSSEARRQVPGVGMRTSGLYLQNQYGPFGYAFGRSAAGDACIYGWQQLRARDEERTAFQNRGNIQIRARICDAEADERELLAVMYGYTINGTFPPQGWNPYGAARPVDPTLGEDSNPILPRSDELSTRSIPAARPSGRPVARQRAAADAEAAQAMPARPLVEVPSPVPGERAVPRGAGPAVPSPVVPAPAAPQPACAQGAAACN